MVALLEGGEVLIGKLRLFCTEALRINYCTEYAFSGLIRKLSGRCIKTARHAAREMGVTQFIF